MSVNFSAGTAGGGGLAGAISGVAAAAGIEVPGEATDPWQRSITSIICESYLAPQVDQARIILADDSQSPSFNLNDTGEIRLGYEDGSFEPVFSGFVTSIRRDLENTAIITLCNCGYTLAKLRSDQSFEKQTSGEIVRALANLGQVETDSIEDGVELPFYVVDSSRTLYQHIGELAAQSGLLAGSGGDGRLNFKSIPAGAADQTFRFGVDILEYHISRNSPALDKVTVVGAGAAGSQGSEGWSWLVKDPQSITGAVGDGDRTRLVVDPSLRSSEAVRQVSAGRLFFASRQTIKLSMAVLGNSLIQAGSKIEITDMAKQEMNGTAIVESVHHYFNKQQGFITKIEALLETGDSPDSFLSGALSSLGGL